MSYLWQDKKHFMWWAISFTKYKLNESRLYIESGILSTTYDEVLLYRIMDCRCTINLLQRIFKTGTVTLLGVDKTTPIIKLKNIKHPLKVKDFISELALEDRLQSGLVRELV